MIHSLKTSGIGPVAQMQIDFASRWNVFVGDNGLGKTFILDLAWYALTRTWVAHEARPTHSEGTIAATIQGKTGPVDFATSYHAQTLSWRAKGARPGEPPGIVLYARADGAFAVWDERRHVLRKRDAQDMRADVFSAHDLWWGLDSEPTPASPTPKRLCRGLIEDWISWQNADNAMWRSLCAVLATLSPSGQEPLEPASPVRVDPEDVRDIPTLKTPYGDEIPILFASTGVRRILSLGYLMLWAWQEHLKAGQVYGAKPEAPTQHIVLLVDELEAHLHPKWQRTIVHALMTAAQQLMGAHVKVQLITATHSPLVMASLEPRFDEACDKVFHLDLHDGAVSLNEWPWIKQGDVSDWLVSDLFELRQARSLEAEEAIAAAERCMLGQSSQNPSHLQTHAQITARLREVLSSMDDFWPRWHVAKHHP